MNIVEPQAILWSVTPDATRLIERAGRVSHASEGCEGDAFIRRLISMGHESVLEHASATLLLVCDRGISHELVRHRIAAYTQESTRYVKYDDVAVIHPSALDAQCYNSWESSVKNSCLAYKHLLDRGSRPEIARSVLPTCLATRIVATMNSRQWRHVLRLRLDKRAHPDMRVLMQKARIVLSEAFGPWFNFEKESDV